MAPASPIPLIPSAVNGDGVTVCAVSISRNVLGARKGVRRPVVGDKRTVVVVAGALEQRLAEPLGDAAVYLSTRQQWVEQRPAVVDREEPVNGDVAGRGVDLDHGDVGAEREREFLGLVEDPLIKPGFEAGRDIGDEVRHPRDGFP